MINVFPLESLEKGKKPKTKIQFLGLILGSLGFALVLFLVEPPPAHPLAPKMAAVAVLMAVWWMTEALPLAATALLPIPLFPLLGIMEGKMVAPIYFNRIIFLFIGGFLIAIAMEAWELNRRVALWIIRWMGNQPCRIVLGFMVATAFLSMWISNTATVVMMVPMALAIIIKMEEEFGEKKVHAFSVSLLLGVAYSASLGGVATLIGTPPNLSFSRIFEISFPEAPAITFAKWMMMAFPLALFLLFFTWVLLTQWLYRSGRDLEINPALLHEEYRKLGPLRYEEAVVLTVSVITAVLWMTREGLPLIFFALPGWGGILPYPGFVDDGTIAILMALILFLVPARDKNRGESALLGNHAFQKLPWGIILLFGGGFALAQGIQSSGLSLVIAEKFRALEGSPPFLVIMAICGTITLLTELASNTATAEITLPILASVAVAMKIHPLLLMIPATLSASFAFMMPVATPPNAIVFGSGHLRVKEMVTAGIYLNVVGVISATLTVYFLAAAVFGIDMNAFPE